MLGGHPWLPRTSCTAECVRAGLGPTGHPAVDAIRTVRRICAASVFLIAVLPLLALPLPGRRQAQRLFCRTVLSVLGIRVEVSGDPVRNLPGMLVVSNHISWVDVFAIGTVLPGSFVARADLIDWPAVGLIARLANVIPIDRRSLRQLPGVVDAVIERLRNGHTVVAFPEGTTYCGRDHGAFRPALFQAAIEAARPIQPLHLSYHHADGSRSTVTAFLGEDSLAASLMRIARARRTVVHVAVRPLQLPTATRARLSEFCHDVVHAYTGAGSCGVDSGFAAASETPRSQGLKNR